MKTKVEIVSDTIHIHLPLPNVESDTNHSFPFSIDFLMFISMDSPIIIRDMCSLGCFILFLLGEESCLLNTISDSFETQLCSSGIPKMCVQFRALF